MRPRSRENGSFSPQGKRTALQAALVHDIGKLFIPQGCLLKNGRLDRDETTVMEMHATQGAEFLRHRGFSDEVVRGVRHHHERWDGTGYPDGREGEKIPQIARIIGVCDALDAMTAGRHYKSRMRPEQIIGEMQAGTGSQFDPAIAETVLAFLRQKGDFASVQKCYFHQRLGENYPEG